MLVDEATVLGLDDVVAFPEEPETGATFEENALAKARQAAAETGEISLWRTTRGWRSTRSTGHAGCAVRAMVGATR